MNQDEIVFQVYCSERDVTFTLSEGSPLTFGKQHIETKHKRLKGKMDAIKRTVKTPDVVCKSERHPNREAIYSLGADQSSPDLYVKVIAEYSSPTEAKIITAWPTPEISEGAITYVKPRI